MIYLEINKKSIYTVALFSIIILITSCENVRNLQLKNAVLERDFKKVKELIRKGADPNTNIGSGSVLGHAIDANDLGTVKFLVNQGADINAAKPLTPLQEAAVSGYTEIAGFLIKKGAKMKGSPVLDRAPPLELAAIMGRWEVFKLLIKNGADIYNTSSDVSRSMLHSASKGGNPQIISYLIDKGIDVNATNQNGEIPLHNLLKNDSINEESIQILIENGANPEIEDNNGKTPRDIARENGHLDTLEKILSRHKEQ